MTCEVHVMPQAPGVFHVQCQSDEETTSHFVTVPESLLDQIGLPRLDPMHLVEATFAYLLEREPSSSIWPEMDLGDLARFFPRYVAEMRDRLRAGGGS